MLRSPLFRAIGAVAIFLALLAFLFRGTVGRPPSPVMPPAMPAPAK
jgi:uncharacterized protein YybS (DUF2232 family)